MGIFNIGTIVLDFLAHDFYLQKNVDKFLVGLYAYFLDLLKLSGIIGCIDLIALLFFIFTYYIICLF